MAKGGKRSKNSRGNRSLGDQLIISKHLENEDSDLESNCGSVFSNSSSRCQDNDSGKITDEFDDGFYDDFESKFIENLSSVNEKSAKTRCCSLKFILNALATKCLPELVSEHKFTIADAVKKSFKRGKEEEQLIALQLLMVLWITIGSNNDMEEQFNELQPLLLAYLKDCSKSVKIRSLCATTLALGCFITPNSIDWVDEVPVAFDTMLMLSKSSGDAFSTLHTAILSGWTLFVTIFSAESSLILINERMKDVRKLLDSSDLDLRITAGESIAVMLEILREESDSDECEDFDELCDKLKEMAHDCQKFRAKKELKLQRSNFRDILNSVEEAESPETCLRFGCEKLVLDSWAKRIQYDMFSGILASGINIHLANNDLLREIFDLGAPIDADQSLIKKSKASWQNAEHNGIMKARTKILNKLRDNKREY